jgi:hypothetical protein
MLHLSGPAALGPWQSFHRAGFQYLHQHIYRMGAGRFADFRAANCVEFDGLVECGDQLRGLRRLYDLGNFVLCAADAIVRWLGDFGHGVHAGRGAVLFGRRLHDAARNVAK